MTDLALAPPTATRGGPGLTDAVRGEWRKLVSLRSTYWTLLVAFVGSVGVTVLATASVSNRGPGGFRGFDPTNQSLNGLLLATLAIGVLGVLAMSGEYGSGTIRSTLAAVPDRRLVYLAKALVVGGVTLVVGELTSFACYGVGQLLLQSKGAPTAALDQPGVARAVVLSGAFLALLAVGAMALAATVRHTAGALAAYAGLTFLITLILQKLPGDPSRFSPLPLLANSVASVKVERGFPSPGLSMGLMVLYVAVVGALGLATFQRKDA